MKRIIHGPIKYLNNEVDPNVSIDFTEISEEEIEFFEKTIAFFTESYKMSVTLDMKDLFNTNDIAGKIDDLHGDTLEMSDEQRKKINKSYDDPKTREKLKEDYAKFEECVGSIFSKVQSKEETYEVIGLRTDEFYNIIQMFMAVHKIYRAALQQTMTEEDIERFQSKLLLTGNESAKILDIVKANSEKYDDATVMYIEKQIKIENWLSVINAPIDHIMN